MKHFVVAFGTQAVGTRSREERASDLRRLLDRAMAAAQGVTFVDVAASVAPDVVMLAFPDATPERVLRLLQAVQGQLEAAAVREREPLVLSVALSFGDLRTVDVLGYSSNFEGRAAIAVARVLPHLGAGMLGVEEAAWEFQDLLRDLGEPTVIKGKHPGEQFNVRLHRRITFAPRQRGIPTFARPQPPMPPVASAEGSEAPAAEVVPASAPPAALTLGISLADETGSTWTIRPRTNRPQRKRTRPTPWSLSPVFGPALEDFWRLADRPLEKEGDQSFLENQARVVGEGLAASLTPAEQRRLLRLARGGETPLLTIESSDDLILSLPWELLVLEGAFVARTGRVDVARCVPAPGTPELAEPTDRLRLVVTVAAPRGSLLDYEAESYRVTQALHEHVGVLTNELGEVSDLLDALAADPPPRLECTSPATAGLERSSSRTRPAKSPASP